MPASNPLLKVEQVTKRYTPVAGGIALPILDKVSIELRQGESLAVVGPSGSGKSTLLQIIGTLDQPSSGTVSLDGKNLNQLNDRELAAVRNSEIGFVFQAHYLLPQCSVLENVLVPAIVCGDPDRRKEAPDRAQRLLARVGLAERMEHRPGQLSGGERQRAAVVRAMINQPKLLLADEPTGSLDHASAQSLGQLLVELNAEEGMTLIVVTHAMELALKMGRVLRLSDGKLVES